MIVKHGDMVAMKFCNRGGRQFFDRHGLDWADFVKNGIDDSKLQHIDDAMMSQVIERARRREQEGK